MNESKSKAPVSQDISGILLALIAVIVWGGNFVIARGVSSQISPISLAFYRWSLATIILLPIAWKQFRSELPIIRLHIPNLLFAALFGIALFNTLVYVAGHYTTAINLALIGTTSSPIMSTVLAYFFLKEKPSGLRILGTSSLVVPFKKNRQYLCHAFKKMRVKFRPRTNC